MAKLLVCSMGALTAIGMSFAIAPATFAQEEPPTSESADVPTALNEIYFDNSGPFFRNRTRRNLVDFIFGFRRFSERDVSRDTEAIEAAAYFLLEDQTTSDPTIRVPDLFNPYDTSVQFLPASQRTNQVSGSEFIFEPGPSF